MEWNSFSMSQAKFKRFKKFIGEVGGVLVRTKSPYELMRYEIEGFIGIICKNKYLITKFNEVAEYHYFEFIKKEKKQKDDNKLKSINLTLTGV